MWGPRRSHGGRCRRRPGEWRRGGRILPGDDPAEAGPDVEIALATGLGEMRNCLIARSASAMIAIGGGVGTLSEIAPGPGQAGGGH
ncbi:MAG: hypothetical protein WA724_00240 [Candidatus Dormiibacterota bacterium]